MQIWGTVMGTERKPGVYIALGLGEVWVGHWVPPNLAGFRECPASQLESRSYTMVSQVFWDQRTGGDNGPSRLQEALQCSCWCGGELASGSSGPGLSLETQCLLEPGKVGSRICAGELSFFLKNGCQGFRNVRRHILSIAGGVGSESSVILWPQPPLPTSEGWSAPLHPQVGSPC